MRITRRRDRQPEPEDGIPPDRVAPIVAEFENLTNRLRAVVEDGRAAARERDDDDHAE